MKMTRPIGIDEVLEERKAIRQEQQARRAIRRAEIMSRLSPPPSWRRWRGTVARLRASIVDARKAAGLTQADAGLLIGVSQRTYRDYERGAIELQCAKVIQLAALLGLTVTVGACGNGQNSAHSKRPTDAGDGSHDAAAGAAAQEGFGIIERVNGFRLDPAPAPEHGSRDVETVQRVNDVRSTQMAEF
ncbi:Helix-turn-helix domain-containing protein [Caenispirillum bisanense]|uniref:Helix-turn-helix domain-containing protein n=1 Tax=Caenispirillum bisanense TaxID=414052 RepID=A0A286GZX0_9PROT|nr:helix-turn-helix domain-containing protein [Caenispirillum bisanense]SOE00604.1 Helix-turn-helix domain-containing protein [Caenispirillum bisanense]